MKKPREKKAIATEVREFEGLSEGSRLREVTHTLGVSRYTNLAFQMPDGQGDNMLDLESLPIGFRWKGFTELGEDHGLAVTYDVLKSGGFLSLGEKSTANLLKQLEDHLDGKIWSKFNAQLERLHDPDGAGVIRDTFVLAAWADLFEEKFSDVWLAAMAHDAYYIEENMYAFGYLVSELDHKRHTETHYLRGERGLRNSKEGGKARSVLLKPRTERILSEMNRLMLDGHSLSRSADLAFRNGHGASKAANTRLWTRHKQK